MQQLITIQNYMRDIKLLIQSPGLTYKPLFKMAAAKVAIDVIKSMAGPYPSGVPSNDHL